MTILYNTDTNEIVCRYPDGYTIDGVLQPLGKVAENILHLKFVTNPMPDHTDTQRVESIWKVQKNKYVQTWQVIQLSAHEIWMRGWHEPNFEIRIVAPKALVFDDMGAKMFAWFQLNDLPVHSRDKQTSCLYCNEILPEHQTLIAAFEQQGVVVEYRDGSHHGSGFCEEYPPEEPLTI
jgi:hypothetical protein